MGFAGFAQPRVNQSSFLDVAIVIVREMALCRDQRTSIHKYFLEFNQAWNILLSRDGKKFGKYYNEFNLFPLKNQVC